MPVWSFYGVKLMQRGYSRSIPGLLQLLRRQGMMAVKPANPKYVAKPYEQMSHPGERIQIDVKFVPSVCLVNEAKRAKILPVYRHRRILQVAFRGSL